jgi:hypothetical protein
VPKEKIVSSQVFLAYNFVSSFSSIVSSIICLYPVSAVSVNILSMALNSIVAEFVLA